MSRAGAPVCRRGLDVRPRSILVAAALALSVAVAPQAARPASAAETLQVGAAATYTLDPAAGRVHVAIFVTATSLKPNSATLVYFYRTITLPVQPGASSVSVSGGASSVTTTRHDGFVLAEAHLRGNLYYRETTTFTLRYDLVGGAPRSDAAVRVGKAFAAFGVWAWGEPGQSTVTVHVPAGYTTAVDGDSLQVVTGTSGMTLSTSPVDPASFFAIITADDLDAYAETRLSFPGGASVIVLGWPEDGTWSSSIAATLRAGIPKLRELIGLDWPVRHDLLVRERYTPALEGYAGIFFVGAQRIDVSEDLDAVTVTHEMSHAWLNEALFNARWIYEGLAEEYAWRTLRAVGMSPGEPATQPDPNDPGRLSLAGWVFPEVIRDQTTDDHERFGYQAAFWVVHRIVEAVGEERMRRAFAAAAAHLTAYPGRGTPEPVVGANDWRRLLDLVSPIDSPEPAGIDAVLAEYGATTGPSTALVDRQAARAAYRALVEQGAGWLPPWFVRRPMGTWAFVGATAAMQQARAVLDLRDQVAAAAGPLGLTPDDALQAAYEGARDGLEAATALADDELAALAAIAGAKTAADATPDLLTQLGLLGETPRTGYESARVAFEAGRVDDALRSAEAASALLAAAPGIGRDRLLAVGGLTLGLLLVLALLAVPVRRRRAGRRAAALATATLAADPAAAPAPPGAAPTDDDGGPGDGDSTADP